MIMHSFTSGNPRLPSGYNKGTNVLQLFIQCDWAKITLYTEYVLRNTANTHCWSFCTFKSNYMYYWLARTS